MLIIEAEHGRSLSNTFQRHMMTFATGTVGRKIIPNLLIKNAEVSMPFSVVMCGLPKGSQHQEVRSSLWGRLGHHFYTLEAGVGSSHFVNMSSPPPYN